MSPSLFRPATYSPMNSLNCNLSLTSRSLTSPKTSSTISKPLSPSSATVYNLSLTPYQDIKISFLIKSITCSSLKGITIPNTKNSTSLPIWVKPMIFSPLFSLIFTNLWQKWISCKFSTLPWTKTSKKCNSYAKSSNLKLPKPFYLSLNNLLSKLKNPNKKIPPKWSINEWSTKKISTKS